MNRPSNPRTDMLKMDLLAENTETERKAKEQMRIEARKIRSKELEKQRKEDDDSGKYNPSNSSRYSSRNSSVEPSLSNISSRNVDSRELKNHLMQLEDKLKNAMILNAQLDSEKQLLRYEVDLLKDKLEDFIDANNSLSKLSSERKKELSYQKMQITELGRRLEIARQQIDARDDLLTEKGLILFGSSVENGSENNENISSQVKINSPTTNGKPQLNNNPQMNGSEFNKIPGMALVSKDLAETLYQIPGHDLESRLRHILNERKEMFNRQEKLELELEEQREKVDIALRYDSRSRSRGLQDPEDIKLLQSARSQAQEYKFKLQESLQRITALEGDIIRLEGQVKRNKVIAETCEAQENELKQDKRKLQREVREMASLVEDLKSDNATLQKRLEKLSRVPQGVTGVGSTLRSMREGSQAR